jgi:hypothetical protein
MGSTTEHIIPPNEQARLAAVRRYGVLETPPDGSFDRITRLASLMLEMPIAIVSLVDHDRIWFKSVQGFEGVEQIDRDPGLCASAILADEVWIIRDAKIDPRALANPLVAGEFGLRLLCRQSPPDAGRLQPRHAVRDRSAAARAYFPANDLAPRSRRARAAPCRPASRPARRHRFSHRHACGRGTQQARAPWQEFTIPCSTYSNLD